MRTERIEISDLITETEAECIRLKYNLTTLENFRDTWLALQKYADMKGESHYHEQLAAQFLHDLYGYPDNIPKSKTARSMIRALQVLGDYRMFKRLTMWKTEKKTPPTDDFRIAIHNFIVSCEKRNNCDDTIERRMWILNKFWDHLTLHGVLACDEITPAHISSFVASLAHLSKKSCDRYLECLRMFSVPYTSPVSARMICHFTSRSYAIPEATTYPPYGAQRN